MFDNDLNGLAAILKKNSGHVGCQGGNRAFHNSIPLSSFKQKLVLALLNERGFVCRV